MSLDVLRVNVEKLKYNSASEFMRDVTLIYSASVKYNMEASVVSKGAKELVDFARTCLEGTYPLEDGEHKRDLYTFVVHFVLVSSRANPSCPHFLNTT